MAGRRPPKPKGGNGATPSATPTPPASFGSVPVANLARIMGLPQDADIRAVLGNLRKRGATAEQLVEFMQDGDAAMEFVQQTTTTMDNLDPATASTDVDLDADPDGEPVEMDGGQKKKPAGLTPEEAEALTRAVVSGAAGRGAKNIRISKGGTSVAGDFRKPLDADGNDVPVDPKTGKPSKKRASKPKPPKPGDPDYFKYVDAEADRKWRSGEMAFGYQMEPPPGTKIARAARRRPVLTGLTLGGLGYGGYKAAQYLPQLMTNKDMEQQPGQDSDPYIQQLMEEERALLQFPADTPPAQQPTMAPSNDGAMLMRLRQSRMI